MPSGRPRTPSRGRPTKRGRVGQSQSASRKTKSPTKKKSKSKSPTKKSTPKPKSRSNSRSRKVATAPAAVSGKRRETPRPASPRPAKKPVTNSRGTPRPTSSITVSTSTVYIPRGSTSPPMLRSRALGVALAQQPSQKSMAVARKGAQKSWRDTIKDNIVTRQIGKMTKIIKRGPRPMFRSTVKHLKDNAKCYFLAFVVLIIAGIIYKFQRELLTNVQQINKQVLEFMQQQYEQQRRIFG